MKALGIIIVTLMIVSIFWFSSKSGDVSMGQSDRLLLKAGLVSQYDVETVTQRYVQLSFLIRKGMHVVIFMILGIGIALILEKESNKIIMLIILLAIFDELHQSFNGRGASLSDVLLDMGGGFTGWAIVESVRYFFKNNKKEGEG